ncbi:hypothetical protein T05_11027 [Trichinella murrelli]|uniref:PiggyBac transposable element-derived protein domain-containing protein n=1 Tax=Trichinella murrelli TaxID=144512 RepID=A0A0V0T7I9_9BILA|nr:hypothetical protein T05_11027 [Trichinella murrelli]
MVRMNRAPDGATHRSMARQCSEKTLVDVSFPAIVKEYKKYMGGVDLARMLRALHWIDHRSRKWYRIFLDTPLGSSERMAAIQKRP